MKKQVLLILIFVSSSCIKNQQAKETTSGSINASAPYLWSDQNFPKNLQISSDFTAPEVTNISDMANAWETALQNRKNFFNIGASTPEITNSSGNIDNLYDGILGIYKTTNWPVSISASALAVTQIFGRRYNTGSNSEYVSIEHADILINYDIHSFDTADSGSGYDLRTVVLHEMGHFLGLTHKSYDYPRDQSVMYPSIYTYEAKRAPKSVDIADISNKYGITLTSAISGSSAITTDESRPDYTPQDEGKSVKILIELQSNGTCIHKEDGVEIQRHQIKLK